MLLLFRPSTPPASGERIRRHYEAERLAILLDEDDLLVASDLFGD